MKKIKPIIALILFIFTFCSFLYSQETQDSIANYTFYQITGAWELSSTDTVEITNKFEDDYYFAFFVEDISGQQFFTIRGYETNTTVCIGSLIFDFTESDSIRHVDFFSSQVFCDDEQENAAESVILEYIPGSEIETGYTFYYLWVIMSDEEALLFLCFDATSIESDGINEFDAEINSQGF